MITLCIFNIKIALQADLFDDSQTQPVRFRGALREPAENRIIGQFIWEACIADSYFILLNCNIDGSIRDIVVYRIRYQIVKKYIGIMCTHAGIEFSIGIQI